MNDIFGDKRVDQELALFGKRHREVLCGVFVGARDRSNLSSLRRRDTRAVSTDASCDWSSELAWH
jgi:hypothetical protein